MKEKKRYYLKKAISELPDCTLKKKNLWEDIETSLNTKARSENFYNKLPQYKAPYDLWGKIEQGLEQNNNSSSLNSIYFLARTAAMIALLLGIGMIIKHRYQIKSPENKYKTEEINIAAEKDTEFESIYNPAICKSNPEICNTQMFKMLDQQLNEVKGEINKMKAMSQKEDPQMMKYFHRLVNERAEIEKKMVKIIIES